MSELVKALVDLKQDQVMAQVAAMKRQGLGALEIVGQLQEGMRLIGQRFEAKEYYLSELIMSAELFKQAIGLLDEELNQAGTSASHGSFLIGTAAGDIHDIGKNIVATVLGCNGFSIIDLGVDVRPEAFVEAVKEYKPSLIGLSCLLTTAFDSMKKTIEAIEAAGLREGRPILIGGAPCNETTRTYVGADSVCLNAHEAVETAKRLAGGGL
ncbi:MAG: cobalamin-dependent protein [Deltaproteobacteria bacterium]|nr:cobalamin-dependent protein [Deltaproteobacteria bacterium]